MSEEYKQCIFVKVDVDENEDVAEFYQIKVMPTFIFIRNGQKVVRAPIHLSVLFIQDMVEGTNDETLKTKIELHKDVPQRL